jgi:hypothetical protein
MNHNITAVTYWQHRAQGKLIGLDTHTHGFNSPTSLVIYG